MQDVVLQQEFIVLHANTMIIPLNSGMPMQDVVLQQLHVVLVTS